MENDFNEEQYIEDKDIREALNDLNDTRSILSEKERLTFFSSFAKPEGINFVKELDGIYYVVHSHFNDNSNEDMASKVRRIPSKEL